MGLLAAAVTVLAAVAGWDYVAETCSEGSKGPKRNRSNFEKDMLSRLAPATQGDWWEGLAQDVPNLSSPAAQQVIGNTFPRRRSNLANKPDQVNTLDKYYSRRRTA